MVQKATKIQFEWDERKNKLNTEKHGIKFEEATKAFFDLNAISMFDRSVGNEKRMHLIGQILGVLIILVVYTERNGNIRIISARKTNRSERELYYGKQA